MMMKKYWLMAGMVLCLSGCPESPIEESRYQPNDSFSGGQEPISDYLPQPIGNSYQPISQPEQFYWPEDSGEPEIGVDISNNQSVEPLPVEPIVVGLDWRIKVPNAGAVIVDNSPPQVKAASVMSDDRTSLIGYSQAQDAPSGSLIEGSGLETVRLWVKPAGEVWQPTSQEIAASSGVFQFVLPVENWEYDFAVQSRDKAGNHSSLVTPEANKPRGRFLYPDDSGQLRLILELPPDRQVAEFLVPGFDFLLYETIYEVGVGGPHGWGEDSADIYPFEGLLITNLVTGFDANYHFRGTPFVITNLARVVYFNLGPPDNPDWEFSFGANRQLIKDDGSGNSIIEFSLADYQAPMAQLRFGSWSTVTGPQPYAVIDADDWDMRGLFWGLEEQTQISQLGVIHYYPQAPWIVEEEPIEFKGWPAYLELKQYSPRARLTIVAIDQAGNYCYINTDVWQAFEEEREIIANNGAWEFVIP